MWREKMGFPLRITTKTPLLSILLAGVMIFPCLCYGLDAAPSQPVSPEQLTLSSVIAFALKNNPRVRISDLNIETEARSIDAAHGERLPKVDFGAGATRYRYPTPLTPIVIRGPLPSGIDIPEFERSIYDTGISFRLPLFRGGRLYRGVRVAEMQRAVATDTSGYTKQELVYNLTSVYFKILQLEKLLQANEASVKQLEAHKKNVELYLKAGTAPYVDLLKSDVELSHAKENRLLVKNSLESTYEFLRTLMGLEDAHKRISLASVSSPSQGYGDIDKVTDRALLQRPDYKAVNKRIAIAEERVKIASGRRLPDVYAAGQYNGTSGPAMAFKENWSFGVRLSVPVFDGGIITSDVEKGKLEIARAREEERALRLTIAREVKDACLTIDNSRERIEVTERAIESARENLRVELLKYDTGAGTTTDVIDAQTAMLRAETDFYQAAYDKEVAIALLRKATGEEVNP